LRLAGARRWWWPIVIPVTILLTLFASLVMGYTLNRVSLFALIFSIGILVDDAIVVIENIARHWAMKRWALARGRHRCGCRSRQSDHRRNADRGRGAVADAVRLGLMGPYMSPIPANASAAMLFSFFVAVMVTPWLMMKIAGKCAAAWPWCQRALGPSRRRRSSAGSTPPSTRPVASPRRAAWIFLIAVGMLTLASLSLFYFKV
jgi:multidrug efflux pump subunit AcrB